MKRPRSYGEDLDDASGEKGVFKDWSRRDPDRPSSHRRFSHKDTSGGWKGSSSSSGYDYRFPDDDREPSSRSSKKRFDYDLDGFDRRKGSSDRYWDAADRPSRTASSPRFAYGTDRIRRSESFSVPRREFPKGFRSERDRSRREDSSGPSWRRSGIVKDETNEEVRSVSSGRGSRVASEDRSKSRSKEDSGGEPSRSVEVKKPVEAKKECCGSGGGSEMEEGELEPEPVPATEAKLDPAPAKDVGQKQQIGTECGSGEEVSETGAKSPCVDMPNHDEEDAADSKGTELAHKNEKKVSDESHDRKNDFVDGLDRKSREGIEVTVEDAMATEGGEEIAENVKDLQACPAFSIHEPGNLGKEQSVGEDDSEVSPLGVDIDENNKQKRPIEAEAEHNVEKQIDKGVEQIEKHTEPKSYQKEEKVIDLETEPGITIGIFGSCDVTAAENSKHGVTLELMTGKLMDNGRDKGKRLAISLSDEARSMEEDDGMDGPSSMGFELVFCSEAKRRDKAGGGGIVIGKRKEDNHTLEPLDLSLGLPGVSRDPTFQDPNPKSSSLLPASSIQSLPSSFRTISDGFTASLSMSGSQTFVHNPSCSLTRNSIENYEHSVGSRPIFNGIDQVSDGTVWRGQTSNELKRKGAAVPLYQRLLSNSNTAHQSSADGPVLPKSSSMPHQSSFPGQFSSTQSHSSHETRSERSKEKKVLTRERSSSSLFRGELREAEQIIPNGNAVFEKNLSKFISEPVPIISRTIQGMTEQSILFLKDTISEIVTNKDKHEELCRLQDTLLRRSDLSLEILSSGHRVLLEILVSVKTGLPDFLRRENTIPSSDLAEIFLNLKCRNLSCRSILPVDECDCKVCSQKSGFCSACMCLLCSKFDMASNTCSWVGCDVCLHWCHTDCALRDSRIRNGRSLIGMQGTEMQFTCVACNHPSEMFGFVKEVFKTCAKDWKAETLAKELEYVRRIFSGSADLRGKRLCEVADHLLLKLENKANLPEVFRCVMEFLADCDTNLANNTTFISPPKEAPPETKEGSNGVVGNGVLGGNTGAGPSNEGLWRASVPTEKFPTLDVNGVLSSVDRRQLDRQSGVVKKQNSLEKKPVDDELESIVKFKQAEAKMYQVRADDARREAEGLRRIAVAKNEKIDEEYTGKITKLGLLEAEEKRRQKLEEFQALERAHRDYFNMKMRMEADIKDLMLKMEATKHNLNSLH